MEDQGTVKVKFPRETNTKSRWAIDPSFIVRVLHSIQPDEDEWITSPEEVQAVLLAIECIPAGIFTQPKQQVTSEITKLRGVIGVLVSLLGAALQVIDTVDGEDAAECEMLMELHNKITYAIEAAHGIKE
jgi:hypothetical protein